MVVISLLSFSLMVAAIVSYIIYKEESVGKWSDRANKQDKLNQDIKNMEKHKKEMEALKRASGKKGK